MDSTPPISQQEIIDQMSRILTFPVFNNSMILTGFLKFIVEETLQGKANSLKEYTIGINVLAKKPGYAHRKGH